MVDILNVLIAQRLQERRDYLDTVACVGWRGTVLAAHSLLVQKESRRRKPVSLIAY